VGFAAAYGPAAACERRVELGSCCPFVDSQGGELGAWRQPNAHLAGRLGAPIEARPAMPMCKDTERHRPRVCMVAGSFQPCCEVPPISHALSSLGQSPAPKLRAGAQQGGSSAHLQAELDAVTCILGLPLRIVEVAGVKDALEIIVHLRHTDSCELLLGLLVSKTMQLASSAPAIRRPAHPHMRTARKS
jgi:hypothetical protein